VEVFEILAPSPSSQPSQPSSDTTSPQQQQQFLPVKMRLDGLDASSLPLGLSHHANAAEAAGNDLMRARCVRAFCFSPPHLN
jgi:hypothetical protein